MRLLGKAKEQSINHCHQPPFPPILRIMCLCWSHPHTLVTGDSARPCHLCYRLQMRLCARPPQIFTSFTTDNSGVLNSATSLCCQISTLAGLCIRPCHLYQARLGPINGLIVPTLDVHGRIWPIFVGSEKCDCEVMLCASRCLAHIGSVMWSDKLLKHLSNPTFQAGFCFHSIAVDLAGSQQPCSRLTLFARLTERTFWLCRPPVPFCKREDLEWSSF